jgi:hypothetical protein
MQAIWLGHQRAGVSDRVWFPAGEGPHASNVSIFSSVYYTLIHTLTTPPITPHTHTPTRTHIHTHTLQKEEAPKEGEAGGQARQLNKVSETRQHCKLCALTCFLFDAHTHIYIRIQH